MYRSQEIRVFLAYLMFGILILRSQIGSWTLSVHNFSTKLPSYDFSSSFVLSSDSRVTFEGRAEPHKNCAILKNPKPLKKTQKVGGTFGWDLPIVKDFEQSLRFVGTLTQSPNPSFLTAIRVLESMWHRIEIELVPCEEKLLKISPTATFGTPNTA